MKAIILFSGGIDSTVMLATALASDRSCLALSFDYGQRHRIELESAKNITRYYNIDHKIISLDPSAFGHSSLITGNALPQNRSLQEIKTSKVPSTYVPARNTLFIAYAIAQAEILQADEIYFGSNAMDCIAYVDCRPEFVAAYQNLIHVATAQAIEGFSPKLVAPLIHSTKKEIIDRGRKLKVPLEMTWSCYNPLANSTPCLLCDACIIRQDAWID